MINYLLLSHRFIIFFSHYSQSVILDNYKNGCETYNFSFETEVESKLIKQRLRGCLVCVFKQPFLIFKQYFMHFNTLFHSHIFLKMFLNNNFQFLNTHTKRVKSCSSKKPNNVGPEFQSLSGISNCLSGYNYIRNEQHDLHPALHDLRPDAFHA